MKSVRLEEIVDICSSKRIKMSEYVTSGIPFYRSKEIINLHKNQNIQTELFITEERFEEINLKSGSPIEGDILLTSVGTLGVPYQVKKDDKFYFKDGNLTWFRNFSNDVNQRYFYFWLTSPIAKRKFDEITIGSTQKALTIVSLKGIEIDIPSISEQNKIAEVIGEIQEKIELNQRMNETLEEIAKTLFKSWFIDFDPVRAKAEGRPTGLSKEISDLFPDSFEDSELGEIPKGWQIGKLVDVIFLDSGFAYKGIKKGIGENLLTTMGCVSYNSRFNDKGIHRYDGNFKDSAIVKPGDICISSHDVTQDRNHIGAPFIIPKTYENKSIASATNTFIVRIVNEFSREFLYQTFKSKRFRQEMIASAKGTAIIHVSKDSVLNFKFCKPTNSIIENFSKLTQPIVYKLENNRDEIATLSELRDTLLPKLISGELKIPDAENLVEEARV